MNKILIHSLSYFHNVLIKLIKLNQYHFGWWWGENIIKSDDREEEKVGFVSEEANPSRMAFQ